MRAGYCETPANATASSRRFSSPDSEPLLCIKDKNDAAITSASARDFPIKRSLIIEVLAWEIEHPTPSQETDETSSPSSFTANVISSPQLGFTWWTCASEPDNVAAAASDNKKYRRNQDKAPSNTSEGGTGTCELCNRSNHTTENCYYLKGCREMVTQQRNQRQQQFSSNTGGYQPQYQSNYGNGPAPHFQPGRQVTYGNTGGVNNSNDLNYGYPGRANLMMRPFNQS